MPAARPRRPTTPLLLALLLLSCAALLLETASAWTLPSLRPKTTHRKQQQLTMSAGNRGVLFICLGNICRSPSAEAVFKAVVEREGKAGAFKIDSCGTGGGNPNWYQKGGWSYHEGWVGGRAGLAWGYVTLCVHHRIKLDANHPCVPPMYQYMYLPHITQRSGRLPHARRRVRARHQYHLPLPPLEALGH